MKNLLGLLMLVICAGCGSETPVFFCETPMGPAKLVTDPDAGTSVKEVNLYILFENEQAKFTIPRGSCVKVVPKAMKP